MLYWYFISGVFLVFLVAIAYNVFFIRLNQHRQILQIAEELSNHVVQTKSDISKLKKSLSHHEHRTERLYDGIEKSSYSLEAISEDLNFLIEDFLDKISREEVHEASEIKTGASYVLVLEEGPDRHSLESIGQYFHDRGADVLIITEK